MVDSSRRAPVDVDAPATGTKSPIADVAESLREAKSFFAYYLATRTDKALLLVRTVVALSAVGVLGLLVAATVLITATVFLCVGIVGGLEQVFGRFGWIGPLLFGAGVLTIVGLAGYLFVRKFTGGSKERLVSAYDRRQRQQQSEFGTDVQRESARARSN